MKKVYVAVSLTHVKTDEEKQMLRDFLTWLPKTFRVRVLQWAFNVHTWQPIQVDNIYEFDTQQVKEADLVIALYLQNEGSDGRGGEIVNRHTVQKPLVVCARNGVTVSRYVTDSLKPGEGVYRFSEFTELKEVISCALTEQLELGISFEEPSVKQLSFV